MEFSTDRAYLVQGVYFQNQEVLGIAMVPIEGAVVVVNQMEVRRMFAGLIWFDESDGEWVGSLLDFGGESDLSNIRLDAKGVSFDKRYYGRTDVITYKLAPMADMWAGGYSGDYVGTGFANCVLTPMPTVLFMPNVARTLG